MTSVKTWRTPGKYTTWAYKPKLTDEQHDVMLWLIGEYGMQGKGLYRFLEQYAPPTIIDTRGQRALHLLQRMVSGERWSMEEAHHLFYNYSHSRSRLFARTHNSTPESIELITIEESGVEMWGVCEVQTAQWCSARPRPIPRWINWLPWYNHFFRKRRFFEDLRLITAVWRLDSIPGTRHIKRAQINICSACLGQEIRSGHYQRIPLDTVVTTT
jgi:hypothetical protein